MTLQQVKIFSFYIVWLWNNLKYFHFTSRWCKMKIFQVVAKWYHSSLSGLYSISAQNDYYVTCTCPVDPGSIQGGHWPISLTREYIRLEYAPTAYHTICNLYQVPGNINSKRWGMYETYYAGCKAEYQLLYIISRTRSWRISQLIL